MTLLEVFIAVQNELKRGGFELVGAEQIMGSTSEQKTAVLNASENIAPFNLTGSRLHILTFDLVVKLGLGAVSGTSLERRAGTIGERLQDAVKRVQLTQGIRRSWPVGFAFDSAQRLVKVTVELEYSELHDGR